MDEVTLYNLYGSIGAAGKDGEKALAIVMNLSIIMAANIVVNKGISIYDALEIVALERTRDNHHSCGEETHEARLPVGRL